jgi:hypothetical protein
LSFVAVDFVVGLALDAVAVDFVLGLALPFVAVDFVIGLALPFVCDSELLEAFALHVSEPADPVHSQSLCATHGSCAEKPEHCALHPLVASHEQTSELSHRF